MVLWLMITVIEMNFLYYLCLMIAGVDVTFSSNRLDVFEAPIGTSRQPHYDKEI